MLITESEILNLIVNAKNEIASMDTNGFSQGRKHRYLSKAFVAGIGRLFQSKYPTEEYSTRFQDFKDGKGIRGEWMFDAAVLKLGKLSNKEKQISYAQAIEVAIESELDPGIKAFFDDFSKLLVVRATNKLYFHGIKNSLKKKRLLNKE